jgi:hypothetical protein
MIALNTNMVRIALQATFSTADPAIVVLVQRVAMRALGALPCDTIVGVTDVRAHTTAPLRARKSVNSRGALAVGVGCLAVPARNAAEFAVLPDALETVGAADGDALVDFVEVEASSADEALFVLGGGVQAVDGVVLDFGVAAVEVGVGPAVDALFAAAVGAGGAQLFWAFGPG